MASIDTDYLIIGAGAAEICDYFNRVLENTEPAMAKLGELGAQVAATPGGLTSDDLGGGLH